MKVVAQCGEGTVFLVHVGDDERGEPIGVVVDLEEEKVHRPFNLRSIIARGYWEEPVLGPLAVTALELVTQQAIRDLQGPPLERLLTRRVRTWF
jgi:hypothetical protein